MKKEIVNKGYYYYRYVVADPNNKNDWTYYAGDSRNEVINHMKSAFSNSAYWDESRLRYFWYISSTDYGARTASHFNKTVYYDADSHSGPKSLYYSGTHYMDLGMKKYSPCYKVKTTTTTYYYWRWGAWSGWGDWTTRQSTSDTVRESSDVRYYVVGRTPN